MKKYLLSALLFIFFLLFSGCKDNIISVVFYPTEGKGVMAAQTFEKGETKALNNNTFIAPKGKFFVGWSEVPHSPAIYSNKEEFTATETIPLFAVWGVEKSVDDALSYAKTLTEGFHTLILTGALTDQKLKDLGTLLSDRMISFALDLSRTTGLEKISESCFFRNGYLRSIIFPDSVTSIEKSAFEECLHLEKVVLSPSLKEMGDNAFKYCVRLKFLLLPRGIESIGEYAFYGSDLREIEVPGTVKSLGQNSFGNCYSLKSAILHEGLESIGNYSFQNAGLKEIKLPDSLTYLGTFAFAYCKKLETANIPTKITEISNYLFRESALSSIEIPDNITIIGENSFQDCLQLKSVKLSNKLTFISSNAFKKTALKSIDFPNTLDYISNDAFLEVPLETITVRFEDVTIFTKAFTNYNGLKNFYCPESKVEEYKGIFDSSSVTVRAIK